MMETMGKVKSDMLLQMNCRLEKYLESFQNKDDDNNKKDEGLFVEFYNFAPQYFRNCCCLSSRFCVVCLILIKKSFFDLGKWITKLNLRILQPFNLPLTLLLQNLMITT